MYEKLISELRKGYTDRLNDAADAIEELQSPTPVRCRDGCHWLRDDWGDKYTPPSNECEKDDCFESLNLEPYCVSELICVHCGKRWIGVYPETTWLKEIECENCGAGFVIKTGQDLEEV